MPLLVFAADPYLIINLLVIIIDDLNCNFGARGYNLGARSQDQTFAAVLDRAGVHADVN